MQLPFAKLSQSLVLYLEGSIDRPLLLVRGDSLRLGVSRPLEDPLSLPPAGEAEREVLEPLRFPLPFPLGTYTGILGSWENVHRSALRHDPFPWLKYIQPIFLSNLPFPLPLLSLLELLELDLTRASTS